MQNNGAVIVYQNQHGDIQLDVRLEGETVWLNQMQIAQLFGKAVSTINEHIKNIYAEGELAETVTLRKFGNSEFSTKPTNFYNLEMIIAVGYRVKSQQGMQFRKWATERLKDYIVKGFVLNDERFKSGNSMQYFDELQARLRDIRLSEKFFYQKIQDIYTTSVDYDPHDEKTQLFFKKVQNKLLWAISQQTAAELVYRRVDARLPLMGMMAWDQAAGKSITQQQANIAKNYLNEDEIKLLGLLVEQYLAFAETMAQQQIPMTMNDWIQRLDVILQLNGRELLTHAGSISHQQAKTKSADELEKYRAQQKTIEYEQSLQAIEEDMKRLNHHD